ncbi:MAG: helix-turn-helix transcriptional regulator [Acidobacteriota bacterium]
MPEQSSLGRELRKLRVASGMTLAELSTGTGVRETYLTAIEDDRVEPSAVALQRLLGRLDPSGASHARVARLLTAPEFDAIADCVSPAHTPGTPVPGDDRRANQPQTGDLDEVAVAAERVWRDKTDVQLAAAAGRFDEYTDEGRRAIAKELDRRGLARPDNGASEPLRESTVEEDELQFDRVITESASSTSPDKLAVICTVCQAQVDTDYYDINGRTCCGRCRAAVQAAAETPRGIIPLIGAGVFGLGAGVIGAALYYAVIAITQLEIGIVAILIGYMVGYSVRRGARGRGGLRFQILAVALTYTSVALAYAPLAFKEAVEANRNGRKARVEGRTNSDAAAPAPGGGRVATSSSRGGLLVGLVILLGLIAALPVLVIVGSFPSGLISAFIIFIGMRQAWRMTGVPRLVVLGPYRVGAAPASTPA